MACPLRIEFPGALYYVTSRGHARQRVFRDDEDREMFLATLAWVVERFRWRCHAYCLMDNHYHLLIETPQLNLSRGMRQLNGVYTQRFTQPPQTSGASVPGAVSGHSGGAEPIKGVGSLFVRCLDQALIITELWLAKREW